MQQFLRLACNKLNIIQHSQSQVSMNSDKNEFICLKKVSDMYRLKSLNDSTVHIRDLFESKGVIMRADIYSSIKTRPSSLIWVKLKSLEDTCVKPGDILVKL